MQMRKEQVVLKDVAEPSPLRRQIDAAFAVEQRRAVDDDPAAFRTADSRQRVDEARLPGARAPEETDDRCFGSKRDVEPELAQSLRQIDLDHAPPPRGRRASHSAATSAASESNTAMIDRRQAWASPPGTWVNV